MKTIEISNSRDLFASLEWVDDNTLSGQKKPKKIDSEPALVYEREFVYRNIPFDFDVFVWRDKDGKIIRDVHSEFEWFNGAFYFAMYLRGEMTGDKTGFLYECYEKLPPHERGQKNLKETARAGLDKTIKDIDWYLDEAMFDLPRQSFGFIQQIKKLRKPMPEERQRQKQISGFEKRVLRAWDRSKKDALITRLSYRGIRFVVALYDEAEDKLPGKEPLLRVVASVPGLEMDRIPGLRFGYEIYERVYGDIREEITFSRKVPLQEKISYGVFYVTRFIDWFLSCPEGDILSETAVILAEMNKLVGSCPARLTCSRM